MHFTATYSPDDNKLRLSARSRLPADLYERVKAAGFKWAPKQEQFVAPMWTPGREDLCIELAGEIQDEDSTLMDRAEDRAERFDEYHDKRKTDAERAQANVSRIADGIPFGQPILVGHHSERHARRDAERIESGMRRAIKAFETAEYWTRRAAAALAHAQYKERPDVRARRIKTIDADKRKQERYIADAEKELALWNHPGLTLEQARAIANYGRLTVTRTNADGTPNTNGGWSAYDVLRPDGERYQACPAKTVQECIDAANQAYPRMIAGCQRWIDHYNNRLAYERAMLDEQGGLVAEKAVMLPGGQVKRRGEWFVILKVNPQSVTVSGHWCRTISNDEIQDYREPSPEDYEKTKAAFKTPPLCNYPGEGFRHMTQAEYDARPEKRWSDSPKTETIKATETHGVHRVPCARRTGEQWRYGPVYITDKARKDPPKAGPKPELPKPIARDVRPVYQPPAADPERANVEAMRDTLKAGIQVQAVNQLFPTPRELAARMVDEAGIQPGHKVLEPSAGTGVLLEAARAAGGVTTAVEIDYRLADRLRASFDDVRQADFLQCNGDLGTFDRIIMNPPFENGADIKHIQHARGMLREGGRLVAICANGPRQREQLMPEASSWEDLPAGTFEAQGTSVNVALVTFDN